MIVSIAVCSGFPESRERPTGAVDGLGGNAFFFPLRGRALRGLEPGGGVGCRVGPNSPKPPDASRPEEAFALSGRLGTCLVTDRVGDALCGRLERRSLMGEVRAEWDR